MLKKINEIQAIIKSLEGKKKISPELRDRIHQIHGEMYGYLRLYKNMDTRLDQLFREIAEINGNIKVKRH